jgi:hypothetical protein
LLRPFLLDVVRDNLFGGAARTGGFFESFFRMTTQRAIKLELEDNLSTRIMQWIDARMNWCVEKVLLLIPDFSAMNDVDTVATGFDVPNNLLGLHAVQTIAFAVPLFLLGLIIFKRTEVAK